MRYEANDYRMKMTSSGKLLSCVLGALNGAVYCLTTLPVIWWRRSLAEEQNIAEGTISGDYVHMVSNERWVPIVVILLVSFTLASLIVASFWRQRGRGSIFFWEVVGVLAVAAWNGFALVGSWLDEQAGDRLSYTWVTSSHNPLFGPISLAVVILVNFVYGYLVRAFEPKIYDAEELDLRSAP